ncbi:MAG: hypothetical protein ACTSVV_09700 [Promethearchaeota archaeon]
MKPDDFINLCNKIFNDRMKVMVAKQHDYANEDALSNFKLLAKIVELFRIDMTKPYGIALFFVLMKVLRICNLIFVRKSDPKNESILDSDIDAKNYLDIFSALWKEKEKEK